MAREFECVEGARPRIRGTFTDEDGVAFTPSSSELKIKKPDGTTDTYTDSTNPGGGVPPNVLEKKLPAVMIPGVWHVRFYAANATDEAVDEITFYVHPSGVI